MASDVAAVTSEAVCVRPPAALTTPVCEVPPPAGMAPKQGAAEICCPRRDQLAVGVDGRVAGADERPTRGDAFGEAHQGDAERTRQERLDQGGIR